MKRNKQSGFTVVEVVIVTFVLILIVTIGYLVYKRSSDNKTDSIETSQDAQAVEDELNQQAESLDKDLSKETEELDSATKEVQ